MSTHELETSIVIWGDRNAPATAVGQVAQAIEASGVVDRLALSDQMDNFFPRSLWKPANGPTRRASLALVA